MANSTILYASTPGGLAIFNKPGTLPEWLPPRLALQGEEVTSVWAEPGPPIRVLAASNGALVLSESGGRAWEPVGAPGDAASPLATIFYDAGAHALFGARYNGQIACSTDGGSTWEALPRLPDEGCLLAFEPVGAGERFIALIGTGGGNALYLGDPMRGDWRPLALGALDLDLIAVATAPGGQLFALAPEGVIGLTLEEDSARVTMQGDGPPGGQAMVALPGAASMPPALVVGTNSGIVVSPDGGANWHNPGLSYSGGATAFARDPERRDRLYAALSSGHLLESGNRGASWQAINAQPIGPVSSLYVVRI